MKMRSAHQPPDTSTRFIGWCPVCERDIKVRVGLLVHHGYRRPGVGYIIGDCPGVEHQPYEKSTDACDWYLRVYVIPKIRETENTLAILIRPEGPPYLTFEHYDIATRRTLLDHFGNPKTIDLTRDQAEAFAAQLPAWDGNRYSWDYRLRMAIINTESKLKHWRGEQDRMSRLVADWRPQPLRTIEQEIERQTQSKAERDSARSEARGAKIDAEVAKIQKRIDSAVKNKNSAVLADIYASHKLREISGYRVTQAQAIEMLDRNAVWLAFGLLSSDDAKNLDEMKWGKRSQRPDRGFDTQPLPWPAALGGGIAKTRGY